MIPKLSITIMEASVFLSDGGLHSFYFLSITMMLEETAESVSPYKIYGYVHDFLLCKLQLTIKTRKCESMAKLAAQ